MPVDKTPQQMLAMLRGAPEEDNDPDENKEEGNEKEPVEDVVEESDEGEGSEGEDEEDLDTLYRNSIKGMFEGDDAPITLEEGDKEEEESEDSPPEIADVNFMQDVDVDELDNASLNKLLNTAYKTGLAQSRQSVQALREEMLRIVPDTVNKIVQQQVAVKSIVDDFYDTNRDLKPYKELMYHLANRIAAKEPELGFRKVFEKTAEEARRILRLRTESGDNGDKGKKSKKRGTGPSLGTGSAPRTSRVSKSGETNAFLSEYKKLIF